MVILFLWKSFFSFWFVVFVDFYMDIIFRDEVIEGGSSDEEEVFESVDEGEEFLKIVKLIFVMLVDIRFVNFMLKELVGKNDVLLIS